MSRAKETAASYDAPLPLPDKSQLLGEPIRHLDVKRHDVRPLLDAMGGMAFSARDLSRAAGIFDKMMGDKECASILCIAGSMVSAGLKHVFADLIENDMVDAVVSTGANVVDQDFFEALGYQHYVAAEHYKSGMYDDGLREMMVDRIYDTFIDEEQLRECDDLCGEIADGLEMRPYTSREFIGHLGKYLDEHGVKGDGRSFVHAAYKKAVPIFVPAFADCSAGFGLIQHQKRRIEAGEKQMLTIDAARDFYELCLIKDENPTTGLFMIGGRRAEELRPGLRGGGRHLRQGADDAQVRGAGDGRRRAGRGAVQQHAQGGVQLGQGRRGRGADGLQRGDAGGADDRFLRLPRRQLEGPPAAAAVGDAGEEAGLTRDQTCDPRDPVPRLGPPSRVGIRPDTAWPTKPWHRALPWRMCAGLSAGCGVRTVAGR